MLVNHDIDLEAELRAIEASLPDRPRKKPGKPEAKVQRVIVKGLRAAGMLVVHYPNGGLRSRAGHMAATADGEIIGWPDLGIYSRDGRHALFEVKPATWKAPLPPKMGQRPSKAWVQWAGRLALYERIRSHGFEVEVVQSLDDALRYLRAWGFVR